MKWITRIINRFNRDYIFGKTHERLVRKGNAYVGWTGQRIELDEDGYLITDHLLSTNTQDLTSEEFWEIVGEPKKAKKRTITENIRDDAQFLWEVVDRYNGWEIPIDNECGQILFTIAEIRRQLNKFEVENGLS